MKVYLLAWLLLLAPWAQAEPIVIHTAETIDPAFDRQVSYFVDEERTFDQDQTGLLQQSFQPSPRADRIEVGFTAGILWGRFQLQHDFERMQNLMLSFHHDGFTRLRVFKVIDGTLKEINRQGGGYTRAEQSFHSLGSNVPLAFVAPGLHEYVIAAESGGGRLGMSFSVSTASLWIDDILFPQYFGKGLFYGMIVSLMLFHLFIFVNNRDRVYGIYVVYIASVLLLFLNLDGLLDYLIPWPTYGGWMVYGAGFAGFMIVCNMLVNKNYFDSRRRFPRINTLFNILLLSGLGQSLLIPFLPRVIVNRWVDVTAGFGVIVVFAASAYVWRRGYQPAKYLFIGRLLFTSFVAVFMLRLYGFFPDVFIVEYSLQIGCLLDMLIMSYGLGVRMRLLEVEKAEAREGERQASFKLNWFNTLVRVITHDLSTPVSVITATSDMELRRAQPSKSLQKNLERIARASQQQANLINHVRDMIAVASGKKELELKPVCLNKALEEAASSLAEMAERKRITLDLVRPPQDIYVAADPTALVNTVFDNFLSNAIKFSEEGSSVRLELDADHANARVRIIDSGIGIPADLIDYLFDPAHATSRPGTARESGTGFGLPLAKVYIEQFHGRIQVESSIETGPDQKRGTCFTIELPLLAPVLAVANG